jgi:acyl-CoA thioesterase II
MSGDVAFDPAADHRFLGTRPVDERTWDLPVRAGLINILGSLYGGAGIAAASAAIESSTGRPLRWITCQFVGTARVDETVRVEVAVEAEGRHTHQCAVRGHVDGRTVFRAVGASGTPRPGVPDGVWVSMPDVASPDDCPPMPLPDSVETAGSSLDSMERRFAGGPPLEEFLQDQPRPPGLQVAFWTRLTGGGDNGSPAVLGWLSDMVAMSLVAGLGVAVGGSSLDNTIRMVERASPPWVLVDLRPTAASDGYGYGDAHLWSPEGRLLATASQTVSLRRWGK